MTSNTVWMGNVKDPECTLNASDLPWGIKSVTCGKSCVNIVTTEGDVFFSSNIKDGSVEDWKQPPGLTQFNVTQVASGSSHHVAMTTDNKLVSWGKNDSGQLGRGNIHTKKKKRDGIFFSANLIPAFQTIRIQQVSCGNEHTLCLTDEGQVYTWGANDCNQLGLKDTTVSAVCNVPHLVKDLECTHIAQIAAGGQHSFALCVAGRVFCWGSNRHGQLGLGIGRSGSDCYHVQPPALCVQKAQSVCCGENHTAFLTLDGRVYTSGLGSSGQLGHASTEDEFVPLPIEELHNTHVSRIACGRNYTLAYTQTPSYLYCFGIQKKCMTDLPNQLDNPAIRCGKDSFFLYQPPFGDDRNSNASPLALTLDFVMEAIKNKGAQSQKEIKALLKRALSKPSCINGSFVVKNDDQEHTESSKSDCGVDLAAADEFFKEVRKPCYYKTTEQALKTLLEDLLKNPPANGEMLRLLVLLPCSLYVPEDTVYCDDIVISLSKLILELTHESKIILGTWLKNMSSHYFKRCVSCFKRCVKRQLIRLNKIWYISEAAILISAVQSCVNVMDLLHEINIRCRCEPISYKKFYLTALAEAINLVGDYRLRLQDVKNETRRNFRFCKFPFLYNCAAKLSLLREQCQAMMAAVSFQFLILDITMLDTKKLHIERERLLEGTREGLSQKEEDLRKRLDVIFEGEIDYCGAGVRQEFFQILTEKLLDKEFGACYSEEDSKAQWFCVRGKEESSNLEDIRFLGLICGLALYNGVLLPLRFPHVLYKKLLNKPVTLEDLYDFKPVELRSSYDILDYNFEDIEKAFELDFSIPVELCPNGADIKVNQKNKHEYVAKVTDHWLNKSAEREFQSFRDGFYTAMPEELLLSFQPEELEEILVGNERYDFEALEKAIQYGNGYHKEDTTIRLFWEVFKDMEPQDHKDFFIWLTGTDRIPAHGMSEMEMSIIPREKTGEDPNEMLPQAWTCQNTLRLPRYTKRDVMKEMLLCGIRCPSGFSEEVDRGN